MGAVAFCRDELGGFKIWYDADFFIYVFFGYWLGGLSGINKKAKSTIARE